jgi:VWFA-related protein
MSRGAVLSLILAACLVAQEPTFKTGISIVEIDASVFDKAGIIDGLKRDDFTVKDERQPVSLRYCVQEETPLDLLFLVELSRMMAPNRMRLRGAVEAAMSAMRDGDRAGVLSFNEGIQVEAPLTTDLKDVKRRVRAGLAYASFAGKPFVLPAVAGATKYLAEELGAQRRRGILMLSSNAGFGLSNQNHMGVAKDLWNADTILAAVVIPTSWTRFIYDDNPYHIFGMMAMAKINRFDYVDDVAEQTGGEMIYTEDAGPMRADPAPYVTVRQAIQRMRRRYRLYFDMPEAKPGQRRRVEIELSPAAGSRYPDARIVARKGYVVPKRQAAP